MYGPGGADLGGGEEAGAAVVAGAPHVPSLPAWTQTVVSVRTDSGADTRTVICPALVKVSVACPPASVLTGAAAPVTLAPAAGDASPVALYLRTVTGTASPTFALGGASTASGAGEAGHAPPKQDGKNSTRSPACSWASQAPTLASFSSSQKDQK